MVTTILSLFWNSDGDFLRNDPISSEKNVGRDADTKRKKEKRKVLAHRKINAKEKRSSKKNWTRIK
jgi:hypothetical protein